MKTSDSINEIAAALAKAQSEMKNAHLNKVNPHFKSKYADLAGIRDAVTPALSKNGIAVVQGTEVSVSQMGHMVVYTRLVHSSGQWIESEFPIAIDKPQAMGSAYTYAKRYSLSAICNIAADEDDDANAANDSKPAHDRAPHIQTAPKLSVHAERERSVPDTADISGTKGAPKNESAKKLYETLIVQMRQAQSIEGLKTWLKLCRTEIETLPDEYMAYFDEAYENHRDSLTARAA
jgi:hypothetical protein